MHITVMLDILCIKISKNDCLHLLMPWKLIGTLLYLVVVRMFVPLPKEKSCSWAGLSKHFCVSDPSEYNTCQLLADIGYPQTK